MICTYLKFLYFQVKWIELRPPSKRQPTSLELVSTEFNHLATISHVYAKDLIFMKEKKIKIPFSKKNGNTITLLIIILVKSLQKEQKSTNLVLWPSICQNKPAITPKWFNSLDTLHFKVAAGLEGVFVLFQLLGLTIRNHP